MSFFLVVLYLDSLFRLAANAFKALYNLFLVLVDVMLPNPVQRYAVHQCPVRLLPVDSPVLLLHRTHILVQLSVGVVIITVNLNEYTVLWQIKVKVSPYALRLELLLVLDT